MRKITLFTLLIVNLLAYGQDFRFGKVSEEELLEKEHPLDTEADAAVLYREHYSHIDYVRSAGFVLTTEVFERIKIYNNDGFEWGTHSIPLYVGGSDEEDISNLKAVTYTLEDGKIEETKLDKDGMFKEERSKNFDVEKFTMPNLQPGCVIEFRYKVISPYLSSIDEIRLQEDIPINQGEITFASPEWLVYKMHQKGSHPVEIKQSMVQDQISYTVRVGANPHDMTTSGRGATEYRKIDLFTKKYEASIKNVPPMREEAFSSNIDNYRSALNFELSYTKYPNEPIETVTSSWEAVSKTIYDSDDFGGQLKNDRFFGGDLDQVLDGVTDDAEKMFRIYEFVKSRLNWNGYIGIYADEGVKSAYKDGVGNSADINLLLVNMLRYAGLDANPVILSTRSNGIPIFPTRSGFNYVIAGVVLDSGTHLLDATNKNGAIDLLEEELLNWNGRMIRENGDSTWVSLSPKEHAVENTMLRVDIADDLKVVSKARSQFTGHYGLSYRRNYIGQDEQKRLESFESRHSGIDMNEVSMENLKEPYKPVMVSYDYDLLNGVEQVGDKLILSPLFHLATSENPFKSDERNHPVDFRYPWKDRYIVTIKLPEGYDIESMPESGIFKLSDNLGEFKYLISKTANTLQVSTELSINSPIISPDLYQGLKEFYAMVVTKENEKVVLKKI